MIKTLSVSLGARSYDIVVGNGLLAGAAEYILPVLPQKRVIVVTDRNVAKHHLAPLEHALTTAGVHTQTITLPPGEGSKSFATLEKLLTDILSFKPERGTTLIALGGGVIGDLTGFAASIILRGLPFIQVPTTLLSQVDSSVGGKTGINTQHGKNLVGSFYQPKLVLADVATLSTLPEREILSGYAEIVKYGLIDQPAFFGWLQKNGKAMVKGDPALLAEAVYQSCRFKAAIVARDEKESDVRALLNLGHTFGHALEAECGYSDELLHGEAVAIGMVMAFALSTRLGLCPQEDTQHVESHLEEVGLRTDARDIRKHWDAERLLAHMRQDKKVKDGMLTFILTQGIGKAFISQDVTEDALRSLLAERT